MWWSGDCISRLRDGILASPTGTRWVAPPLQAFWAGLAVEPALLAWRCVGPPTTRSIAGPAQELFRLLRCFTLVVIAMAALALACKFQGLSRSLPSLLRHGLRLPRMRQSRAPDGGGSGAQPRLSDTTRSSEPERWRGRWWTPSPATGMGPRAGRPHRGEPAYVGAGNILGSSMIPPCLRAARH